MLRVKEITQAVRKAVAPLAVGALLGSTTLATQHAVAQLPDPSIRDEVIYFLMPDRFNNSNTANDYGSKSASDDVLVHGHAPSDRAMYHGGDIQGITEKLDYIQKLGATTIWTTPIMVNKTVQYEGETAGWISGAHGFWVTDFLNVEPHFGTNEEFANYVDAAHARDMKVVLDILINHTADVFGYEECNGGSCDYVSKDAVPYLDLAGNAFDPDDYQYAFSTALDFPLFGESSFPFTAVTSEEEANIKNPEWLNDPQYYHNRGYAVSGESALYGDFARLDDLFTEHPHVIQGLIDIYSHWINTYGVDGYRIDAARHVQMSFFEQWRPAIEAAFIASGKDNYMMFGEVFDPNPAALSQFTDEAGLPQVLDFSFQAAAEAVISKGAPTTRLQETFADDDHFTDPNSNVYYMPTFLGNHDMGRFGAFLMRDNPTASDEELFKRSRLAHALMFTARGIPTVYYGDEQGFTGLYGGHTWFETARQDMFASVTPEYANPEYNQQIAAPTTPAANNFDEEHPLYLEIREFASLRRTVEELRQGAQVHRYASDEVGGGIYAFSRIVPGQNKEVLVVLNTSTEEQSAAIPTFYDGEMAFDVRYGDSKLFSKTAADENGIVNITLPALDFVVLKAKNPFANRKKGDAPSIDLVSPATDFGYGQFWVEAEISEDIFASVDFYVRAQGSQEFVFLGSDDNAPYRINYDGDLHALGTGLEFQAVVTDYAGNESTSGIKPLTIENRLQDVTVIYENGNARNEFLVAYPNGTIAPPQSVTEAGYTFEWPEGVEEITLFYSSNVGNNFAFDMPLTLNLVDDVIPNATLVEGGLDAVLYVNNAQQVSNVENFDTDSAPVALPFDLEAANPLSHQLYIRGSMNGWGVDNELAFIGSYAFTDKVVFETAGQHVFKFADANWNLFNYGTGFNPLTGMNGSGAFNDIIVQIPEGEAGLYDVHMFAYPNLNGGVTPYVFYRLARDTGPLGDLTVEIDGVQPLVYNGSTYEVRTELSGGSYTVVVRNSDGVALSTETLEVATGGVYRTVVDAADPANPVISTVEDVNHGPYGAMYLRGGEGLTGVANWDAAEENLFVYDEAAQTLSLTFVRVTEFLDQANWAFKVADANWNTQFGGQSGDWMAAQNNVDFSSSYSLAYGNALTVTPGVGEYEFVVDVADPANPVLTVEYTNYGPYGPVYVRGGYDLTGVADWAAVEANKFKYDELAGTLTARVATVSEGVDQAGWAFKVANESWGFQLGGQAYAWLDTANELALNTPYALSDGEPVFVSPAPGVYTLVIDVNDPANPVMTVNLQGFGPYGALYLRGGYGITGVANWDAAPQNLFAFDAATNTLNLTVSADSSSIDQGDWAFKLANIDWSTQLTGQSGMWLDPANEVVLGVDYSTAWNLEPLFVAPLAGEYSFVVDVTDSANPVLRVDLLP